MCVHIYAICTHVWNIHYKSNYKTFIRFKVRFYVIGIVIIVNTDIEANRNLNIIKIQMSFQTGGRMGVWLCQTINPGGWHFHAIECSWIQFTEQKKENIYHYILLQRHHQLAISISFHTYLLLTFFLSSYLWWYIQSIVDEHRLCIRLLFFASEITYYIDWIKCALMDSYHQFH